MMFKALDADENYFWKLQWFSHEKIEEYNELWNFLQKTNYLLSVFSHSEFCISIFIFSELNIIHFFQYFSAQDFKQICLVIENYNAIQFCFKKYFDEIDENLSKII